MTENLNQFQMHIDDIKKHQEEQNEKKKKKRYKTEAQIFEGVTKKNKRKKKKYGVQKMKK